MENGRNMTGGGFGRRSVPGVEAPSTRARVQPAKQYVAEDNGLRERLMSFGLGRLAILAVCVPISLEAIFSSTSLITPINSNLLNITRAVGFILGIPLSLFVITGPEVSMGTAKKVLMVLFTPLFAGFAANEFAWRIADRVEFGFSSAPFAPVSYPITAFSLGRKGARDSFSIDPFDIGERTEIAVPSAQFEAVWLHSDDYCMQVMQRRSASGAVEILNDGVFTLSEPAPAKLTLCPEEQQERKRRDEEYRRQRSRSHS